MRVSYGEADAFTPGSSPYARLRCFVEACSTRGLRVAPPATRSALRWRRVHCGGESRSRRHARRFANTPVSATQQFHVAVPSLRLRPRQFHARAAPTRPRRACDVGESSASRLLPAVNGLLRRIAFSAAEFAASPASPVAARVSPAHVISGCFNARHILPLRAVRLVFACRPPSDSICCFQRTRNQDRPTPGGGSAVRRRGVGMARPSGSVARA